jgi:hypothetical protein
MDYIEIMLRGYSNENDRKFLSKYFVREFRKAEKEHYDLEEFFTGLLKGIDTLKNEYQKELFKRKNELYLMLEAAENGTLKYGELKSESAEERRKKTIEYCKNELTSIGLGYSKINLLHFTNSSFIGHLQYSEVEFIGNGIAKAYKVLNEPQQNETGNADEVYKTQNLFKVGLLFAKGEMNKYCTINNLNEIVLNNGLSPLKIAKELGNPSFEKWILASKNNYKNGENKGKNIFNNLYMMTKIILDCEAKNIPVEPYFISRLPIE